MPKHHALIELVGTMRVHLLAELAGITVGELAALILADDGMRSPEPSPKSRAPSRSKRSRKSTDPSPSTPTPSRTRRREPRPPKSKRAAAKGRSKTQLALFDDGPTPTLAELHEALDRWLIGEAIEQMNGNITHAAERLATHRKRVRNRWAEVRDIDALELQRRLARIQATEPSPTLEDLRAIGTLAAVHDAVDHWALGAALTQEEGNLSAAARRLAISRRTLRKNWARLQPG